MREGAGPDGDPHFQEAGGRGCWSVGKRPVVGRMAQIQVQAFTCQLCAFESSHDLGGCAYS